MPAKQVLVAEWEARPGCAITFPDVFVRPTPPGTPPWPHPFSLWGDRCRSQRSRPEVIKWADLRREAIAALAHADFPQADEGAAPMLRQIGQASRVWSPSDAVHTICRDVRWTGFPAERSIDDRRETPRLYGPSWGPVYTTQKSGLFAVGNTASCGGK
jgi:hypothetical protein